VLVTHDPLDAMVLADRLVVVEHGRVVQEGMPQDIARHPRTDHIAQLSASISTRATRKATPPSWTPSGDHQHRGPHRPGLRRFPARRRDPPPQPSHRLQRTQPVAVRGRRAGDPRRPDPREPHRRTTPRRRPHHHRGSRTRSPSRRRVPGDGKGDTDTRVPGLIRAPVPDKPGPSASGAHPLPLLKASGHPDLRAFRRRSPGECGRSHNGRARPGRPVTCGYRGCHARTSSSGPQYAVSGRPSATPQRETAISGVSGSAPGTAIMSRTKASYS
jgi:hypothetical protein